MNDEKNEEDEKTSISLPSFLTSCRASSASAVHRKGSGATPLVISRA